jgi:hypothetical protein
VAQKQQIRLAKCRREQHFRRAAGTLALPRQAPAPETVMSASTEHHLPTIPTDVRALSADELDHVSGGMKWQRGTANPDVIDARGGQWSALFFTLTFDVNGKVSSIQGK